MSACIPQACSNIANARKAIGKSPAQGAVATNLSLTVAQAGKSDKIARILNRTPTAVLETGALCFLDLDRIRYKTTGSGLKARLQNALKRHGRLYRTLLTLLGPVLLDSRCRRKRRDLLARHDAQSVVVNLGSGPALLMGREDIINVDLVPFDEVDIVADGADLPLESESVDLLINTAMLEHVPDPAAVVREMHRVSKVGGEIFCYLPFVAPYHAAPDDFWRWTLSGVTALFAPFAELEVFVAGGPTSGMLWVFQEWAATALSFGSPAVHDVLFVLLMILTSPLKLLDALLAKYPNAQNIASGFCVAGRKT